MSIHELTSFFGWMSVINIGVLFFIFFTMMTFKPTAMKIHRKLFDISEADLQKIYFQFIARYKMLTIFFGLVPYFALRIMS